jgi:glycosyltransferase involved in cell wall biosynthesis
LHYNQYKDSHQIVKKLYNPMYYVAISGIEPRKNWHRLIEAHHRYTVCFPSDCLTLILAGSIVDVSYYNRLLKYISTNKIRHIEWVLHPTSSEKDTLLKGAIFLIYPSLYEGFGFPILEAFSAYIPVVVGNVSSMPEIARDAALYINPLDTNEIQSAIQIMHTDKDFSKLLRSNAIEKVGLYSWSEIGKALHTLIDKKTSKESHHTL